jgi:hypothetical protein
VIDLGFSGKNRKVRIRAWGGQLEFLLIKNGRADKIGMHSIFGNGKDV